MEQRDPWKEIEQWKTDYLKLQDAYNKLRKDFDETKLKADRFEALLMRLADSLLERWG